MTLPALDTGRARLTGVGYLRVDHLAAGDELRFAIHDDEHVVGVVVHVGAALHAAVGNDDQALILEDAPALDEGGRNLVVVYVAHARWKMGGSFEVHSVVADRAGFRGVLPLVRGLGRDRDHVALSQMMTHAVLDRSEERRVGVGYLRVDHLAPGNELRFAIHDDEHVVGVVVYFGTALHAAVCDDDQALILEDAPALDEGGRNLVVVYVAHARWKMCGSFEVHSVVADRPGFRRVLPLVRSLRRDRDHIALGQMMTHAVLDAGPARLAGLGCLRVDQFAAGDELRFAIHDDEHVVGVVVHL